MPQLEAVDLSQFNTAVEYKKLHDAGVRHAWIRVWSGDAFDTMKDQHREACQHVGIKCFGYWVANPMLNPNSQGGVCRQHLNSDVWDKVAGEHMWALDWEMAGLDLSWAQRFGQPPVLYRSLSTQNVFPDARQWVADWNVPHAPVVHNLIAWQYTNHLEGYAGGPLDASETYFEKLPTREKIVTNKELMNYLHEMNATLKHIHEDVVTLLDRQSPPKPVKAAAKGKTPAAGGKGTAGDSGGSGKAAASSPTAAPDTGATDTGGDSSTPPVS